MCMSLFGGYVCILFITVSFGICLLWNIFTHEEQGLANKSFCQNIINILNV